MAVVANVSKDRVLHSQLKYHLTFLLSSESIHLSDKVDTDKVFTVQGAHSHSGSHSYICIHDGAHNHILGRALASHPLSGTQQGGHVSESEGVASP